MTTDAFKDKPIMPKFSTPHFRAGVEIGDYSLGDEKYEWQIGPSGAVLAVSFQRDSRIFLQTNCFIRLAFRGRRCTDGE